MAATGNLGDGGGGTRGGGEVLELRVAPGSDGAMAHAIMHLARTGKLQILRKAIV